MRQPTKRKDSVMRAWCENANGEEFAAKFMARVTIMDSKCWEWKHPRTRHGYGIFSIGRDTILAHRLSYWWHVGPIPEGLTLDHLCRNTSCVNPAHLEAVSATVNILRGFGPPAVNARKTHCKNGHPLDGDNLGYSPLGHRHCRLCHNKSYGRDRRAANARRRRAGPVPAGYALVVEPTLRCVACGRDIHRYGAVSHSRACLQRRRDAI